MTAQSGFGIYRANWSGTRSGERDADIGAAPGFDRDRHRYTDRGNAAGMSEVGLGGVGAWRRDD
ncbi:hypothetical protein LMG23994_06168 [Cupriavidus pinatubonensis]|uniref:Uncharacterized protein n=1 Tax=Cupriavidus pinatubonensis TaxID=248026 RepID=A0ABM8Y0T7_9BURK|nr:hypothetical protein LMG23994_06168 [Cupriavidus pinatubonensis]